MKKLTDDCLLKLAFLIGGIYVLILGLYPRNPWRLIPLVVKSDSSYR